MFIVDGRVAWVGEDDAAATYADQADRIVDLDGRLVTPGFVDAHAHLGSTGFALGSLDLSGARSVDRRARPAGGVRPLGGVPPDDGAVRLRLGRVDLAESDGRSPRSSSTAPSAPGRVRVAGRLPLGRRLDGPARRATQASPPATDGAVTGWWRATRTTPLARCTHRLWTPADREHALRVALGHAASRGITSVHELNAPHIAPFSDFATLRSIAAETPVPEVVRLLGRASSAARSMTPRQPDCRASPAICASTERSVRAPPACTRRTPTRTPPGTSTSTATRSTEHVVHCTERGLQAGFHVIGDRALTETVAGFEQAADKLGVGADGSRPPPARARRDADPGRIATLARLGVVASVQPAFDAAWGGPEEPVRAPSRQRPGAADEPVRQHAPGRLVLAFGSDSPITPLDPWAGVRAADAAPRRGRAADRASGLQRPHPRRTPGPGRRRGRRAGARRPRLVRRLGPRLRPDRADPGRADRRLVHRCAGRCPGAAGPARGPAVCRRASRPSSTVCPSTPQRSSS